MDIEHVWCAVVHCSATPPTMDVGVEWVTDLHKSFGWSGCGYHHVIRRDGKIEAGRSLDRQGAHVRGNNYGTWGVCLIGGVDSDGNPEDNFTSAQYKSLLALLTNYKARRPDIQFKGHRDFSPDLNGDGQITKDEWVKDCPCFDVAQKIKEWGL